MQCNALNEFTGSVRRQGWHGACIWMKLSAVVPQQYFAKIYCRQINLLSNRNILEPFAVFVMVSIFSLFMMN